MTNLQTSIHLRHFLEIEALDKPGIEYLFQRSEYFLENCLNKNTSLHRLEDKIIVNLFFEPSTRTLHSFEIAAKKLGAIVINPDMSRLSLLKGESLIDTVNTFEAMGASALIVRHSDNHKPHFLASELLGQTAVINAGDGTHQHPTQGLLDLLTIHQHKGQFEDLTVAIVGDVAHSRVARSLVKGLKIMGTSDIRIVAPLVFVPEDIDQWGVTVFSELTEGIRNADVVMMLRIQRERLGSQQVPTPAAYFNEFGLTYERLESAKSDVIVMHPGPINRGIEIESSVADGSQSVILQQVRNGVAMRMALLDSML